MVPGNVFPTYGKSHGAGRFLDSARNDIGGGKAVRRWNAAIRCQLSAFRGALDTQGSDWERRFEERDLRFERADCRLSAVRLAWCPETYSLFAAGHMARGDFRAPLEMTRGAENSDNQMSDLCCFCSMLF